MAKLEFHVASRQELLTACGSSVWSNFEPFVIATGPCPSRKVQVLREVVCTAAERCSSDGSCTTGV